MVIRFRALVKRIGHEQPRKAVGRHGRQSVGDLRRIAGIGQRLLL